MGNFLAAVGRFDPGWLVSTPLSSSDLTGGADFPLTAWGFAYCLGNRLESIRVPRVFEMPNEFARLAEIKTDMALFYLHEQSELAGPRLVQPFVRREAGLNWAFCHMGTIRQPERLIRPTRAPDSSDRSELFFMHLIDHFVPGDPIDSIQSLLSHLTDEPELSFVMMSPDMMVVTHWVKDAAQESFKLWLGKGELLRIFTSFPPFEITGVDWSELANHSVTVIFRERRSVG
jgi:hypothetical protein